MRIVSETRGAAVASLLIQTKLRVPRPRRGHIARPRLDTVLNRGDESRLTLVSAPAGFGKTTLLASWLGGSEGEERTVAWLSLAEGDGDPGTFWTYLIAALQTAVPGIGESAAPLIQTPRPPVESVLAIILNELGTLPHDLYLVLDDYHLADGPGIQDGVAFLLEHLPPQVHLAIGTRADPALPLARLRARGELVEVRAADLRFSLEEATQYLSEATGRDLDAVDVDALEQRTEGWIAALQLAALSLQGRDDVAGFVAGFAGDDRFVVDYLVEEVLQRQPDRVRSFLLQTSILDRLSGPLCDAVTGQHGGKATLELLDRSNLFLVPLDDGRRWYRYHHLFADVLRAHLLDEHPGDVPRLHRRASQWYDQVGEPVPAVRHALAAEDAELAADLMEPAIPALRRDRLEATIRGWIDEIPDEVLRVRPVLAMGFAGVLMARSEFEGVAERLLRIEQVLDASGPMAIVDREEFARLPGELEIYRGALALVRGDAAGTVSHAERAVERAAADDHLTRGGASALAGLASWSGGELESAHSAYSTAADELLHAGHISDVLGCSITLADLRITQGRLSEALRTYEDALLLASREATTPRGTADMHVGIAQIACERNDLQTASQHLQRAAELGEQMGLPQNAYRRQVASASMRRAEGDLAGACGLLEDASRVYMGDFSPNVRPVAALRARLLVSLGRLDEATAWVRRQGLSVDDDLSYARECEHITLARALLAQGSEPAASLLLERLLAAVEQGGRTGSVIEILVLQALAHRDVASALPPLERALRIAEPEGYVRVFVDEGEPMESLLRSLARQKPRWPYVSRLLDAYAPAITPASGRTTDNGLVEPLSERELEVLRLLGTDLDGPEIARELVVSLNTLRTHTKHIYTKLGVRSRRAAIRRAAQLGLLPRSDRT